MATIGKISMILEAQHESFKKGIKESIASVDEFKSSVNGIKGLIEGAFAFAGISIGVSALKEMVSHTIETTASQYHLSESLGITVASLQALQTDGEKAGIKSEQLNTSLLKMSKSLGEAAAGGGKGAEALKSLG